MANKSLFASLRDALIPRTDTVNSENAPAYALTGRGPNAGGDYMVSMSLRFVCWPFRTVAGECRREYMVVAEG